MSKRWIFFLAIVLITVIISSIWNPTRNVKPKIVVVLKELDSNPYWYIVKAGAEKGFEDFNIDGLVFAPSNEYKIEEQENLLESLLKQNPDALIVSPIEESIISLLKKFNEKNIPVLLIDTDDPWENKTSYIGTNNFDLGKLGGALLGTQLQPGDKVALITGDIEQVVIGDRIVGAKTSLEAAGITTILKTDVPNNPLQAKSEMENLLDKHPDINGVYATTDILAIASHEIINKNGYNKPVIGADGIVEMIKLIENETLSGTVAQNPYDMGYLSVETAVRAIKGENVEMYVDSGVDIIVRGNATHRKDFIKKILR
ncbi:hypothetical protein BKP45_14305 [Anaerobacillus alkalidiazotrophicus]|uniref:Periplasmic binding protein domain-containing protein n=1 Tax=Anaerobacillus alkalidiazotrophicus TaxID=472963 RepID=A0A1S2M5J7_9BACI|nr:sugar ABC transporter substrate-binding protein [Anaerobacillus alkalidiazotrophicus]OIJ19137.1 hypothetical protein BKP45_14305 [Anaerobacillus alkalidiazotrophicus]